MKQVIEQFEVLDHLGRKTGQVYNRGAVLEKDEYMGIVTIIVINKEGKFLVTRRHPNKAPGLMWEVTGGGIQAFESPEAAACRELGEETGIKIKKSDLIPLRTLINAYFYCYQYIVFLQDEVKLSLGEDEVIDYKFLSADDFFAFIKSEKFIAYIGERITEVKDEILKLYAQKEIENA